MWNLQILNYDQVESLTNGLKICSSSFLPWHSKVEAQSCHVRWTFLHIHTNTNPQMHTQSQRTRNSLPITKKKKHFVWHWIPISIQAKLQRPSRWFDVAKNKEQRKIKPPIQIRWSINGILRWFLFAWDFCCFCCFGKWFNCKWCRICIVDMQRRQIENQRVARAALFANSYQLHSYYIFST